MTTKVTTLHLTYAFLAPLPWGRALYRVTIHDKETARLVAEKLFIGALQYERYEN